MNQGLAALMLLLGSAAGNAHRLDEYLQAALFSVGSSRLEGEITLTPGVAVFPMLAASLDPDGDGMISPSEQHAYAGRVLLDLSFAVDGRPLRPRLISVQFPGIGEMKDGMGGIRIAFEADLPRGGPARRLVFNNRHQSRIGAYLVNCLVPSDPAIRIVAQKRNESQSHYELDYLQAGGAPAAIWWPGAIAAMILLARFAFLWRQRSRTFQPSTFTTAAAPPRSFR